jgi:hypothetical protein
LPRQNYRHMKKQKEESRKARQAEKRQRRQLRTGEESGAAAGSTTDAGSAQNGLAENAKSES